MCFVLLCCEFVFGCDELLGLFICVVCVFMYVCVLVCVVCLKVFVHVCLFACSCVCIDVCMCV